MVTIKKQALMRKLIFSLSVNLCLISLSAQKSYRISDFLSNEHLMYDSIRWNATTLKIEGYKNVTWVELYNQGDRISYDYKDGQRTIATVGANIIEIFPKDRPIDIKCHNDYCVVSTKRGILHVYYFDNQKWTKKQTINVSTDNSPTIRGLSISDSLISFSSNIQFEKFRNVFVYRFNDEGEFEKDLELAIPFTKDNSSNGSYTAVSNNLLCISTIKKLDRAKKASVSIYRKNKGYWFKSDSIQLGNAYSIGSIDIKENYCLITDTYQTKLYEKSNNRWELIQNIDYDFLNLNYLSSSVLGNDKIIIGTPYTDSIQRAGGAILIYQKDGDYFSLDTLLTPTDLEFNGHFGKAIQVNNNWVVAKSNSNQLDYQAGAIYLFKKYNQEWREYVKIIPSKLNWGDEYGPSFIHETGVISLHNHSVLFTSFEDINKIGQIQFDSLTKILSYFDGYSWKNLNPYLITDEVDSNRLTQIKLNPHPKFDFVNAIATEDSLLLLGYWKDTLNGNNSGSVRIYKQKNENRWEQIECLTPESLERGDKFGYSIGKFQNKILIGAIEDDEAGDRYGSVYVYDIGTNSISRNDKLLPEKIMRNFGQKIGIANDKIVISGYESNLSVYDYESKSNHFERSLTPFDFPGAQFDIDQDLIIGAENQFGQGDRLKISKFIGRSWINQGEINISKYEFISSVRISDDQILIGSTNNDDYCPNCGCIYVFEKEGIEWKQKQKLIPSNLSINSKLGYKMETSGKLLIVSDRDNNYLYKKNELNKWQLIEIFFDVNTNYYGAQFHFTSDFLFMQSRRKDREGFELLSYSLKDIRE